MQPQGQAGLIQLIMLTLQKEVAAVQKAQTHTFAAVLGGVVAAQNGKGVLMVAGGAAHTVHHQLAVAHGGALGGALEHMPAVKADQIIVAPAEVQARRQSALQLDLAAGGVVDHRVAGDGIQFLKNRIVQGHLQMGDRILQQDGEGFALPAVIIHIRQPLRPDSPGGNGVGDIAQVALAAAVTVDGNQARAAEIPAAKGGVLLGQGVHREIAVHTGFVGVAGKAVLHRGYMGGQILVIGHLRAVVQVQQVAEGPHLHLIGGVAGLQGKELFFRIYNDSHLVIPSISGLFPLLFSKWMKKNRAVFENAAPFFSY